MSKNRKVNISFRVSSEEKEMIKSAAKAFEKTISGFIRDIILGISSDVVRIRRFDTINSPKLAQPLHLNPPGRILPQIPKKGRIISKRGSANDFRLCMEELKKALKEKNMLAEC